MTNGFVAAHLISKAIGGGTVPWAEAFNATRIGPTEPRAALDRQDSHPASRHCRVTGHREPRCTHQGCVLRADTALGSWDCPCHGSRFEADGTVIQGPATSALHLG